MQHACHSGGSPGADAAWRREGAAYGVETRSYRPQDDPQPEDSSSVVKSDLLEADPFLQRADQAGFEALSSERDRNYVRRNWFQVKHSDAVYAVGRIIKKEESGKCCDCVAGGTAWAVLMAMQLGRPIYVFDDEEGCPSCTRLWHYCDHASGRLLPLPPSGDQQQRAARPLPPPLPQHFAGVGTRSLGPAGEAAIREIYSATFRSRQGNGAGD